MYRHFNVDVTTKPPQIVFPSGATIVLGHLADADAYQHYQGQEFHRMNIEELTNIPSESLYEDTIMSCRSTFKCKKKCKRGTCRCGKMVPQIFNSTNPLGPGHHWVYERFINLKDKDGNDWPVNKYWSHPKTGRTRIFIPATLDDNPLLGDDYKADLEGITNPAKLRAWRYGKWDIGGSYFEEFRPKGPMAGEPDEANHVYDGNQRFYPWWAVDLGVDWGYDHNTACMWGVTCPDTKRMFVDQEFIVNKMASFTLGVEIALRSMRYLEGRDRAINMWLSHEVFDTRDATKTIAQQIESGINSVLGTSASMIVDTRGLNDEAMVDQLKQQQNARITIRRAENQRVSGWNFMHDLMRWKRIERIEPPKYSEDYFTALLHNRGAEAAMEYRRMCFNRQNEVLPKILISDKCPKVISGIMKAQPNPPNKGNPEDVQKNKDDNEIDALRYLCMGARFSMIEEPMTHYVDRMAQQMIDRSEGNVDVGQLIRAREFWESAREEELGPPVISVPRFAGRRFRQSMELANV